MLRNYTTLSERTPLVRKSTLAKAQKEKKQGINYFCVESVIKKQPKTLLLHILVITYRSLHKIVDVSCHQVDYVHQRNCNQSVYWPGLSQFFSAICEGLNSVENLPAHWLCLIPFTFVLQSPNSDFQKLVVCFGLFCFDLFLIMREKHHQHF